MQHPHYLWNFMLDTVYLAENDGHLEKIASNLAEHILAYYGSMIPHFEKQAANSTKFAKMLTGVWRHKMGDDVWMRLRKIQTSVVNPLGNMISLEYGVEYMAGSLAPSDRDRTDKGRYRRNATGGRDKQ
jgi:hypothetical protein